MPRAFHIMSQGYGNYLSHVRAMSSFRTAGSLESENKDSVQMNKNFKNATSNCILTFGQPSNMNPGCAYTNPPSLRIGYFTYHSDSCTKRHSCDAVSHFLLKHLLFFYHCFKYPCISLKAARSTQPAVIEESAPPRELLRLSPIEGSRCLGSPPR